MRWVVLGLGLSLMASQALAAGQAVNSHLLKLHDDLRLSGTQEAAWSDYTHAIAANPQAEARRRSVDEMIPQLPTPRRIALISAAMEQDLADFRRQGQAVTTFYATLTPSQQRTFDIESLPAPSDQNRSGQTQSQGR